jgi:hypothetical protein
MFGTQNGSRLNAFRRRKFAGAATVAARKATPREDQRHVLFEFLDTVQEVELMTDKQETKSATPH